MSNYELYHWGVKGMKWGVRRYQNKDGSLTSVDKKELTPVQKKARTKKLIVAGAAVATTVLAVYGAKKISSIKAATKQANRDALRKALESLASNEGRLGPTDDQFRKMFDYVDRPEKYRVGNNYRHIRSTLLYMSR
jgi:hypothetical protein